MTGKEFDAHVDYVLSTIKSSLQEKGKEYRRNNNPLHNFEAAATKKGETRERALYGMAMKHVISIDDMRNDLDKGIVPSLELVNEKFKDAINYLILEHACYIDRINNLKKTDVQ